MSTFRFLGAAGCVTGSRHLVEHAGARVLLDCGLFQGEKALRSRNWDPFPVDPSTIDAVVLSHAHIDHTGWLPRLVREGFKGRVFCTPATRDLCAIMLPDSARLQEEEAEYANRKQFSKHSPALPLYTEEDANAAVRRLRSVVYGESQHIADGVTLTFHHAGHILGSATVSLDLAGEEPKRVVFSGDLGRYGTPIISDPDPVPAATVLIVESTYGDRQHDEGEPREALARVVEETVRDRRVLLIPAFAIGRTQDILYHLRSLQLEGRIPSLPIIVDSPMACDATPLFLAHTEEHDDEMRRLFREGRRPLEPADVTFARSVEESKRVHALSGPLIILSASGMATGGRILHHLKRRLPDPGTTVLFVGYQAAGSRGRRLLEGEQICRIHGENVTVRARVSRMSGFSAHADRGELGRWLDTAKAPPTRTFCVHGEPAALTAMQQMLETKGWRAEVPRHLDVAEF